MILNFSTFLHKNQKTDFIRMCLRFQLKKSVIVETEVMIHKKMGNDFWREGKKFSPPQGIKDYISIIAMFVIFYKFKNCRSVCTSPVRCSVVVCIIKVSWDISLVANEMGMYDYISFPSRDNVNMYYLGGPCLYYNPELANIKGRSQNIEKE